MESVIQEKFFTIRYYIWGGKLPTHLVPNKMAGCYGNQASILNVGGMPIAEGVVTQFDHIRLQREGEGEGREEGV